MSAPTKKDIEIALRDRQLTLYYQPILAVAFDRVVGFEALLRWRRSSASLQAPLELIRVAEETGQILEIGRWALQAACEACKRINRGVSGGRSFVMSVNVAARHWVEGAIFRDVVSALASSRQDPSLLKLELTESSLVSSPDVTRTAILRLKEYGVGTCIDDFGTGYASLGYLSDFPVDTIKIDRAFIHRLGSDPDAARIPRAFVDLAHGMRMDVIAEGVETEEQLREVNRLNCEYVQGFLFAPPLTEHDAIRFTLQNAESTLPGGEELVESGACTVPTVRTKRGGGADPAPADCPVVQGISGPMAGSAVILSEPSVVFGRDSTADVVLRDPHASRHHARIVRDGDDSYLLEDCGSTNGTFCNGQRVQRCPLRDLDRIRVGTCVFEFRIRVGVAHPA